MRVDVFLANEKIMVRNQLHIPNDLFFSILSKLPIKSLKRFGCVHKSWSLLFDNPSFMTMYRNNFLTKDHSYYNDATIFIHQTFCPWDGDCNDRTFELYCVSGERFENRVKLDWPNVKLDPIYLNKEKYDSGFNILGSCSVHGILCLFCASQNNIILWNPSTKQFKVIPPSPLHYGPYWDVFVDRHEFGYDRHKDDYKVMCRQVIVCDHDVQDRENISSNPYINMWEIYSLRSNSWRKLDIDTNHNYMGDERLYIDGLSHGLCTSESETHNEAYLLSFDWSNEIFLTTSIPSDIIDGRFEYFSAWRRLVLLNGSIALILNYTDSTTFHISILGELGVKESWTKIFTVGPLPCPEYPIGAAKKGDMSFRKNDGELVWFDLNPQMFEDLGVITSGRTPGRFCYKIVIHKENLLPFEGANI